MTSIREYNKDFIGFIIEEDGQLNYFEYDIAPIDSLIEQFNELVDDSNKSVLDMQVLLNQYFPKSIYGNKRYSFIYPSRYSTSYIKSREYPEIISKTEYEEMIHEYREKCLAEYCEDEGCMNLLELYRQLSEDEYREIVDKLVHNEVNQYILDLKYEFISKRLLYALNYYKHLSKLLKQRNVLMYSTEKIGWTVYRYDINADVSIQIKSNFGYGSAAYFYCNLLYKDISIVPYTDVVKYYYVNWVDFVRYTRKYGANRNNWRNVFEFTVETVNLIRTDIQKFVEIWIVRELKQMMEGLTEILNNPESITMYMNKSTLNDDNYILARNCNLNDIDEYKLLPEESYLAFKIEKVTGCLFLLKNLKKLEDLSEYIQICISEILSMNESVRPEVLSGINGIEKDITIQTSALEHLNQQVIKYEQELKPHIDIINDILEKMNNEKKGISYNFYEAERKYIIANKNDKTFSYEEIKKKHDEYCKQRRYQEKTINLRKRFIKRLNEYIDRIDAYCFDKKEEAQI